MSEAAVLLAIAAGITVLGSIIALAVRWERRQIAAKTAAWKTLARELGGRFEEASGPWHGRKPSRILVTVDGVDVVLDTASGDETALALGVVLGQFGIPDTKFVETATRATTQVPSAHSLLVEKRDSLMPVKTTVARMERRLGGRDLDVGDPEFDQTFHVDGHDEHWVRDHLDDELRRLHARNPNVSVRLKEGEVVGRRSGTLCDGEELRGLLAVVSAHARALA